MMYQLYANICIIDLVVYLRYVIWKYSNSRMCNGCGGLLLLHLVGSECLVHLCFLISESEERELLYFAFNDTCR